MLFADRNKAYGAYIMRRDAGKRYAKAMKIVLGMFLAAILTAIATGFFVYSQVKDAIAELDDLAHLERLKPIEGHEFKEVAQSRRSVPHMKAGKTTSRPEIVEGLAVSLDYGIDVPESAHGEQDEIVRFDNDSVSNAILKDLTEEAVHLTPTEVVEEMPSFPGGVGALMKWLDAHIIYTAGSVRDKVEGDMEVSFIVDEEGRVQDPHVTKSLTPTLDRVAVSAITKMPRWTPARSNGRLTHVMVSVPIHFQLK